MGTSPMSNAWILYSRPNPRSRLRLFCFPYAGGGASIFRTWSQMLPTEIEVCAVQLPGRENRMSESPFLQLSSLVQALTKALQPYLTMPFAFFGHSMGALIGFELARQLRSQKSKIPVHLFVSASLAPQIKHRHEPIYQLPDAEFLQELHRLNGTAQGVLDNAELRQLMMPVLRADFTICDTYVYTPEEPLPCPISAFGGYQDSEVTFADLEAWHVQTSSSFKLHTFQGDHFFLRSAQAPLLQAVAHDLTPSITWLKA